MAIIGASVPLVHDTRWRAPAAFAHARSKRLEMRAADVGRVHDHTADRGIDLVLDGQILRAEVDE
jgi:hypothetical protein